MTVSVPPVSQGLLGLRFRVFSSAKHLLNASQGVTGPMLFPRSPVYGYGVFFLVVLWILVSTECQQNPTAGMPVKPPKNRAVGQECVCGREVLEENMARDTGIQGYSRGTPLPIGALGSCFRKHSL